MESLVLPVSLNLTKSILSKLIPKSLSSNNHKKAIITDFMAYARKVPIRKQNVKTYNYLTYLWKTFISLSVTCNHVDIVFDAYNEQSMECGKRRERTTVEGNEAIVTRYDQPVLVEMIDSDLFQQAKSHFNDSYHGGL